MRNTPYAVLNKPCHMWVSNETQGSQTFWEATKDMNSLRLCSTSQHSPNAHNQHTDHCEHWYWWYQTFWVPWPVPKPVSSLGIDFLTWQCTKQGKGKTHHTVAMPTIRQQQYCCNKGNLFQPTHSKSTIARGRPLALEQPFAWLPANSLCCHNNCHYTTMSLFFLSIMPIQ